MRHTLVLLLLLARTTALFAQEDFGADPNVARGISPSTTYRTFGIDTINEFNGNLMLRIPIGGTYAVGPALEQDLVLVYNSKLYDIETHVDFTEPNIWIPWRQAFPEAASNAGFGWSLQLGTLLPPDQPGQAGRGWFYRAPDGAEHDFLGSTFDDPVEAFTRDGSFLRLRRFPADIAQDAQYREITFPDGIVHRFDPAGRLTEIRDRFGHWIKVDYSDAMKWSITNGYGSTTFRTITVNYEPRTAPYPYSYAHQSNFQKVVKSVVVPAFQDVATYRFSYSDEILPRDSCSDRIFQHDKNFAAPFLTEIELPDGSKYIPSYALYEVGACQTGMIKSLKLPTLGTIEWQPGSYLLPKADCDEVNGWISGHAGVAKRTLRDASDEIVGVWEYVSDPNLVDTTKEVACGPFDGYNLAVGLPPTLVTTTVTQKGLVDGQLVPVGGSTVHHFSGARNGPYAAAHGHILAEYGMPFTRGMSATTNPARFLSSIRKDEDGTVVEKRYVTYESDPVGAFGKLSNPRVKGELTVFETDDGCGGKCMMDVDRTDYDGYGRFRKSTTTSNFGPTRTVFTNYTPRTDTWILGVYDSSWTEESGFATNQSFTFDTNGFLAMKRTYHATAATASEIVADERKDLLEVFCRDARGFLSTEKFFGGDGTTAALPASDFCGTPTRATEYQIDHTYSFDPPITGAPIKHTARYAGTPFNITDEDFHASTGFVTVSRDSTGLSTQYDYDLLGRLTEFRPPGIAWALYEYSNAFGETPATLRVTTRKAGTTSAAGPETTALLYYDSFGRVVQEKRFMPTGTWATRTTSYDLFSRPVKVSLPEFRSDEAYESDFVPSHVVNTEYDIFGRVTKVRMPDGKEVVTQYTGQRQNSTTRQVATAIGTETAVTTIEDYDHQGRLVKIRESSSSADETSYGYDGANRLRTVSMKGAGLPPQPRSFTYDGRGFLASESHPESQTTTYEYDSRGHIIKRVTPAAFLTFGYDAAERLEEMADQGRILKTFVYDGTAPGKLDQAVRVNWHLSYAAQPIEVKETYTYDPLNGLVANRKTEISSGPSFDLHYRYNTTGLVDEITYPSCADCDAPPRVVKHGYTAGRLTGVGIPGAESAYATIDYHANAMVRSVQHGGLPNTSRPLDEQLLSTANGMPRPDTIVFSGFCADFAVASHPVARTVRKDEPAGLKVDVPGAQSFQWFEVGSAVPIAGQTSSTLTKPMQVTGSYWARAGNGACTVDTQPALVTVEGTCATLPSAVVSGGSTTIDAGQQAIIAVNLQGAAPWTIEWSDQEIERGIEQSPHYRYVTPSSSTVYSIASVKDRFGCPAAGTGSATVTVNPPPSECTLPNAAFSSIFANVRANSTGNRVIAAAATGATYSWTIEGDAVMRSGQGTNTIYYDVLACSGMLTISVTVTNDCGTATKSRLVEILSPEAFIDVPLSPPTVDSTGRAMITATLTGVGPWTILWSDGVERTYPDGAVEAKRDVYPTMTTRYRVSSATAGPESSRCAAAVLPPSSFFEVKVPSPAFEPVLTAPSTAVASSLVSASVSNAPAGASYQWSITNGTIFSGANGSSITFRPGCDATSVDLSVTVTASCGTTRTQSRSIAVTPLAATVSGAHTIDQGKAATITAAITGTAPWTVTWSDGVVQNNVTSSPATRLVSPIRTTTYSVTSVKDSYGCAGASSGSVKVTVIPPAPPSFTATAITGSGVLLQWVYTGTTDQFQIERFVPGSGSVQQGTYELLPPVAGSSRAYVHAVTPGKAYVYRIRAVMTDGAKSAPSTPDLATTVMFSDDPLRPRESIFTTAKVLELRAAVDAVRALAPALGPGSYPSSAQPRVVITRATIEELRDALASGRAAIGLPAISFTDRPLPTRALIRAVYLNELRGGVK